MLCKNSHGPQDESNAIANSVVHFFRPQLVSRAASEEEENDEEDEEDEESQVIKSSSYVDLAGWTKLRELLEGYFPSSASEAPVASSSCPTELKSAIKTQLQERHLQCLPGLMEKVCLTIM